MVGEYACLRVLCFVATTLYIYGGILPFYSGLFCSGATPCIITCCQIYTVYRSRAIHYITQNVLNDYMVVLVELTYRRNESCWGEFA